MRGPVAARMRKRIKCSREVEPRSCASSCRLETINARTFGRRSSRRPSSWTRSQAVLGRLVARQRTPGDLAAMLLSILGRGRRGAQHEMAPSVRVRSARRVGQHRRRVSRDLPPPRHRCAAPPAVANAATASTGGRWRRMGSARGARIDAWPAARSRETRRRGGSRPTAPSHFGHVLCAISCSEHLDDHAPRCESSIGREISRVRVAVRPPAEDCCERVSSMVGGRSACRKSRR